MTRCETSGSTQRCRRTPASCTSTSIGTACVGPQPTSRPSQPSRPCIQLRIARPRRPRSGGAWAGRLLHDLRGTRLGRKARTARRHRTPRSRPRRLETRPRRAGRLRHRAGDALLRSLHRPGDRSAPAAGQVLRGLERAQHPAVPGPPVRGRQADRSEHLQGAAACGQHRREGREPGQPRDRPRSGPVWRSARPPPTGRGRSTSCASCSA